MVKAKIDKTIQRQFVFSAENIKEIEEKISMGIQIPRYQNPWFKNQTAVRRTGCVYGWTQHELEEFAKCKMDIHYFANNYCKIKTEDGQVKQMKLRDYQYKVLDVYDKNRFVINMSSRQTGKCVDLITNVTIKENNIIKTLPVFKILFKYKDKNTIYDWIKYPIYWLLWKLN